MQRRLHCVYLKFLQRQRVKHTMCPVSYTHLDVYKRQAKGADAKEADADVVIQVAVPAQTTVELCSTAVSYTHLDVYKRQHLYSKDQG